MKPFFLSFFFLCSLNIFCQKDDLLQDYAPSVNRKYEILLRYIIPFSNPPKTSNDYTHQLGEKLRIQDFNGALEDITKIINLYLYIEKDISPFLISEKYLQRASIRFSLKQYFEAIQDCNSAIIMDTTLGDYIYSLRAHCKAELGDIKGAFEDFNEKIYSRGDPNLLFWRAYYRLKVGFNKETLIASNLDLLNAVIIKPEFAEAIYLRGIIDYLLGFPQNACDGWSEAGEQGYEGAYKLIKKYCQN